MICKNCGNECNKNAIVCIKCGFGVKQKTLNIVETLSLMTILFSIITIVLSCFTLYITMESIPNGEFCYNLMTFLGALSLLLNILTISKSISTKTSIYKMLLSSCFTIGAIIAYIIFYQIIYL